MSVCAVVQIKQIHLLAQIATVKSRDFCLTPVLA